MFTTDPPQLDELIRSPNCDGLRLLSIDWSPDGGKLVFNAAHGCNTLESHLFVMDATPGAAPVELTQTPAFDPAWSPTARRSSSATSSTTYSRSHPPAARRRCSRAERRFPPGRRTGRRSRSTAAARASSSWTTRERT
jgi:hypothetical protein